MKKIVSLICACWIFLFSNAQSPVPTSLYLSTDKTTSLIFPSAIRHVDRGTKDVLVQQVGEVDNLLLLKAAISRFKETNLSVVTADGHLYSFNVIYDSLPLLMVYRLESPPASEIVNFKNEAMNSGKIADYTKSILNVRRSIGGIKNKNGDVLAKVTGIYIKENVMFFQFRLNNHSLINYDIDFLRYYIRDAKKTKRTANQEVEVKPIYVAGNIKTTEGEDKETFVVAFEKFTIPEAKYFGIEIMEKNGGRHLFLKVKNKKLVKARLLRDLQ